MINTKKYMNMETTPRYSQSTAEDEKVFRLKWRRGTSGGQLRWTGSGGHP